MPCPIGVPKVRPAEVSQRIGALASAPRSFLHRLAEIFDLLHDDLSVNERE